MLARIESDWRTAGLSAKRISMLEYVEALTRSPTELTESNIGALREVGFTDRDIHDICEVTAYYAYVNRIADGLGVSLETWIDDD